MDVANWLRSLGLGKYEAAFRDNVKDKRTSTMTAASARPVSTTERRCRPSPKRHNLLAQDPTPKRFPDVTRADIGLAAWRVPHVTRADIGSL
jgi:SAM domain (Sterile alpha motif)